MQYNIMNRMTGDVQFTAEIDCDDDTDTPLKIGLAVKWAIGNGANLRDADLRCADLIDGGQRSDGYRFVGWIKDGKLHIRAGVCRNFEISDGRKHWERTRGGTPLGDETMCILDHIEAVAKIRGIDMNTEAIPIVGDLRICEQRCYLATDMDTVNNAAALITQLVEALGMAEKELKQFASVAGCDCADQCCDCFASYYSCGETIHAALNKARGKTQ